MALLVAACSPAGGNPGINLPMTVVKGATSTANHFYEAHQTFVGINRDQAALATWGSGYSLHLRFVSGESAGLADMSVASGPHWIVLALYEPHGQASPPVPARSCWIGVELAIDIRSPVAGQTHRGIYYGVLRDVGASGCRASQRLSVHLRREGDVLS